MPAAAYDMPAAAYDMPAILLLIIIIIIIIMISIQAHSRYIPGTQICPSGAPAAGAEGAGGPPFPFGHFRIAVANHT